MDRNQEIYIIEEYIRTRGVKRGPVAFVCTCIQAHIPDRKFQHSNVQLRYTISRMKRRKDK